MTASEIYDTPVEHVSYRLIISRCLYKERLPSEDNKAASPFFFAGFLFASRFPLLPPRVERAPTVPGPSAIISSSLSYLSLSFFLPVADPIYHFPRPRSSFLSFRPRKVIRPAGVFQ